MRLFSGALGNYSEVPVEELQSRYGSYLMAEEEVQMGFKLVRDTFLFTNERLIFIDHQGATGRKVGIFSIHLGAIYEVTMETADIAVDDSEITIYYVTSPYYKANDVQTSSYTFEFGKKSNVGAIYVALSTVAHENSQRLNG